MVHKSSASEVRASGAMNPQPTFSSLFTYPAAWLKSVCQNRHRNRSFFWRFPPLAPNSKVGRPTTNRPPPPPPQHASRGRPLENVAQAPPAPAPAMYHNHPKLLSGRSPPTTFSTVNPLPQPPLSARLPSSKGAKAAGRGAGRRGGPGRGRRRGEGFPPARGEGVGVGGGAGGGSAGGDVGAAFRLAARRECLRVIIDRALQTVAVGQGLLLLSQATAVEVSCRVGVVFVCTMSESFLVPPETKP